MTASILMLLARIALAGALYAFLTIVLLALWRDQRTPDPRAGRSGVRLRWLEPAGAAGREFVLQGETLVIGRSPTAEISLADETVSIAHARVRLRAGRWVLEDLDSRNGTLLNGIAMDHDAVLCPGDRIRVGRCELEFRADGYDIPPTEQTGD
jgi:hypothetical protein